MTLYGVNIVHLSLMYQLNQDIYLLIATLYSLKILEGIYNNYIFKRSSTGFLLLIIYIKNIF